jgi:hypothetical protein
VNEALLRVGAIVKADFLIRFRRVSTVVVFLLLSAFAYVWVPAPSTGRALLQLQGRRALYNSAAIGMASASLAMIFIGLFGFYVISNALRRDVISRSGLVIASTTMRSGEYLFGKVVGNIAFLATFVAGFGLTSMIMQLVRGEAPLEPLIFIQQYLLLTSSAIVFVAATAVLFESVPLLSGKLGDVAYFVLWLSTTGGVTVGADKSGSMWLRCLDFSGFAFMMDRLHAFSQDGVAIGSSPFDPSKPPIVFHGITLTPDWIVPRLAAMVIPLLLLIPARLFFHRFDPVRTRKVAATEKRNLLARLQMLFKPLTRNVHSLLTLRSRRGASLLGAAWTDGVLTLTIFPAVTLAMIGFSFASLISPTSSLQSGLLPIAFAAFAVMVADISTRDVRAGTTLMLFSTPRIREHFVLWKFLSTLMLGALFFAVPLLRSLASGRIVALLVGILFVSAAATALGAVTENPKTFIVGFLTFWYVVMNDKGQTPGIDFAGFFTTPPIAVVASYAAATGATVIAAHLFVRWRQER